MSTHNICLYKELDKTYTGCDLKTTELLDCALNGVCAIIRSNTVFLFFQPKVLIFFQFFHINMLLVFIRSTPAFVEK